MLEFVQSASLDGLHGLFFAAGIGNSLLAQLSCILILIFVLFLLLFILFVYIFGRAYTILRTRDRDALGFESFLDGGKLFEERCELLNVERDSLKDLLVHVMTIAITMDNKDPPSFPEASLHLSRRTRGCRQAACP